VPTHELDGPRAWTLDTYLVPPGSLGDRAVVVEGPEGHHAVDVARVRPGDVVRLIDGEGTEALARVEHSERSRAALEVLETRTRSREEGVELVVVQALLKRKGFEETVRRCAELGVAEIVPVVTDRSVARGPGGSGTARLERWGAVALAAVKQSRGVFVPKIHPFRSLDEIGALPDAGDLALVAWEEERGTGLAEALRSRQDSGRVILIVGPEGGLAPKEVDSLVSAGFVPVTAGRRVLKADWAAAAIAAMVSFEVGGLLP